MKRIFLEILGLTSHTAITHQETRLYENPMMIGTSVTQRKGCAMFSLKLLPSLCSRIWFPESVPVLVFSALCSVAMFVAWEPHQMLLRPAGFQLVSSSGRYRQVTGQKENESRTCDSPPHSKGQLRPHQSPMVLSEDTPQWLFLHILETTSSPGQQLPIGTRPAALLSAFLVSLTLATTL